MVEKIYEIKNQVVERLEREIQERGIDRADIEEVSKLADVIKDLAEAEEKCWKAEYYRNVSEAMENGQSGYSDYGNYGYSDGRSSRTSGSSNTSSGYRRGSRRGYMGHQDPAETVRYAMQNATPEEKQRIMHELGM